MTSSEDLFDPVGCFIDGQGVFDNSGAGRGVGKFDHGGEKGFAALYDFSVRNTVAAGHR